MTRVDELDIESSVQEILNRRPAVGLAVGVVRDGSLEFFSGHGLADIVSHTPVTEDTAFRVGSLTKTFTGIAVMQLQEQGLVPRHRDSVGGAHAHACQAGDTALGVDPENQWCPGQGGDR